MKPAIVVLAVLVLFGAGVGAGVLFLRQAPPAAAPSNQPVSANDAITHGISLDVPDDAEICAEHRVPEMICPFCKPALVEELGWCGGHDVAEALCTRCHPNLIAAFKAENDWCAEHELPESQCLICNPEEDS